MPTAMEGLTRMVADAAWGVDDSGGESGPLCKESSGLESSREGAEAIVDSSSV